MRITPLRLPRTLAWTGVAVGVAGAALGGVGLASVALVGATTGCSDPPPTPYCSIVSPDSGDFLAVADADAAGGTCPDGEVYQQPTT